MQAETKAAAQAPGSTHAFIRVTQIHPSTTNPRQSIVQSQLQDLVRSIDSHGVQVPLLVREIGTDKDGNGGYELVCGARRLEVAKILGMESVPVIIRDLTDAQAREAQVIENLQRADLHPLDEALGFAGLVNPDDERDPTRQVAEKVGKSDRYVAQRLQLVHLDQDCREFFVRGYITLEHALILARLQPEQQPKALRWIFLRAGFSGKMSAADFFKANPETPTGWQRGIDAKELAEWVRDNVVLSLAKVPWDLADTLLVPAAGPCTECPFRAGSRPALFGDLVEGDDVCTKPLCFDAKRKAFVAREILSAKADGKQLVKISERGSYAPIKEGSALDKTLFRAGQWVPAGKVKCDSVVLGVFADGEHSGDTKRVCVDQKCKVHKHRVDKPGERGSSTGYDPQKWERERKEKEERFKKFAALELPIRRAVFSAISAKMDVVWKLQLLFEAADIEPTAKFLGEKPPKRPSYRAAVDWLFAELCITEFNGMLTPWTFEDKDKGRGPLWELAKKAGVNADGIAKKLEAEAPSPERACKVCGCTENNACLVKGVPCSWHSKLKDVCTNPKCVKVAQKKAGRK